MRYGARTRIYACVYSRETSRQRLHLSSPKSLEGIWSTGVTFNVPYLGRFKKGKNYFLPEVENVRSNRSNGTARGPLRHRGRTKGGRAVRGCFQQKHFSGRRRRGRKNSTASIVRGGSCVVHFRSFVHSMRETRFERGQDPRGRRCIFGRAAACSTLVRIG